MRIRTLSRILATASVAFALLAPPATATWGEWIADIERPHKPTR